jgi:AcrR family transcriptional regulator
MSATSSDAKERLLAAATKLFARYGYAATSARRLANEAGTNVAMISYYFGGKRGLLEAVFDDYFAKAQALEGELDDALPPGARADTILAAGLPRLVAFYRREPDLIRVVFTELAFDEPEAAAHKRKNFRRLLGWAMGRTTPLLRSRGLAEEDAKLLPILIIGAVAFHFLMQPVFSEGRDIEMDDAFYERFTRLVSELFAGGIGAVAARSSERTSSEE